MNYIPIIKQKTIIHKILELEETPIGQDLYSMLLGDFMGEGQYRKVYIYKPNTDYIIKIEKHYSAFNNILEWDFWTSYNEYPKNSRQDKIVQWLAPCRFISPNGIFLIQEKTEPLKDSKIPNNIPSIFSDISKNNLGLLNGKIVFHDYAINKR